ncbi:MAG: ABC transporter substrate-binding protein [Candidatus Eisenbacteria bacterium]|uniref:ABC transporter substrate-binding protein n=1 Tax=Eiseniibacteriota bacterium TaxID=2212470 RepID=A0A933SE13_UNCEI|nr:ABC transporter substrate-binding protein [Candidatus Eisenbacteria bacterium]
MSGYPHFRFARAAATVSLLALLLLSAACMRRREEPLRIAITPWPGHEFLYLAQERGFFAEEGVSVRLVELESQGDSRAAFENGAVDVFAGTLVELLVSHTQGSRHPQAFYVTDYSNGSDVLLADSTVRTIADLRGRRIALEAGSVDVVGVAAALASAGLTMRDVELVPMPQNEKDWAFEHSRVQAVQCFPPAAVEIASRPGVHPLFDSSRIPGLIVDVLVADSSDLHRNPGHYAATVRAIARAQRWASEHRAEALAVMAAREGLTPEEFARGLDGLRLVPLTAQSAQLGPGGNVVRALRLTQDALTAAGASEPIGASESMESLVTARALAAEASR